MQTARKIIKPTGTALRAGMSTRVFGTPGYIDPGYVRSGKVPLASDIYAFGVVVLEMLCPRPANDPMQPADGVVLVESFEDHDEDGRTIELVDTRNAGWATEAADGATRVGAAMLECAGTAPAFSTGRGRNDGNAVR